MSYKRGSLESALKSLDGLSGLKVTLKSRRETAGSISIPLESAGSRRLVIFHPCHPNNAVFGGIGCMLQCWLIAGGLSKRSPARGSNNWGRAAVRGHVEA